MACYLIETTFQREPVPQVREARYYLIHAGRKILMDERTGCHAYQELLHEVCDDLGMRGVAKSSNDWSKAVGNDWMTTRSLPFQLEVYETISFESEPVRR